MKDFYDKQIATESAKLTKLLEDYPVPYMSIDYSGYPTEKSQRCGHANIRYIEKKLEHNGMSVLVMNPYCDDCAQYISAEDDQEWI